MRYRLAGDAFAGGGLSSPTHPAEIAQHLARESDENDDDEPVALPGGEQKQQQQQQQQR